MQAFCDKIYNWCMEIVSWSPGDNGRVYKPIKPEHAYFAAVAPSMSTSTALNGAVNGGYEAEAEPAMYAPAEPEPTMYVSAEPAAADPQNQSMADFLKSQGQGY